MVFIAATISFVLLHLAPGTPYDSLFSSPLMTPALQEKLRVQYGYDQPLAVQFLRWLGAIATGEFGWSISKQRPVLAVIGDAIPRTLLLMSLAFISSIVFGVLIGMWQALRAGTRRDRFVSAVSFVVYSMPEFWLAMILLVVFAGKLRWLPTGKVTDELNYLMPPGAQFVDRLRHLVLPWLALTLVGMAVFARFQRAAMRDVLHEPFIRNATARGLPMRSVNMHALRASLTPVVTVAGMLLPALVTGAVFVEVVFSWNGMGFTLFESINNRDYSLMSAIVVIGSAMTVLGSILADLLRMRLDPRSSATL